MAYKTAVGALFLYEREDGTYLACKKTRAAGVSDVRQTRFVILGEGQTVPAAIRAAAEELPEDVDGLRWGDLESLPDA